MTDQLTIRYAELGKQSEIQNMTEYAADWQRLGNEAAQADRLYLAESCYQRAKQYAEYDGGHYYRVVNGCLAELHAGSGAA